MDKVEEEDWRVALQFLALFLMWAALIYFGAQALTLSHDLKKSQCDVAYWKARSVGYPSNYCPTGCECYPQMFR